MVSLLEMWGEFKNDSAEDMKKYREEYLPALLELVNQSESHKKVVIATIEFAMSRTDDVKCAAGDWDPVWTPWLSNASDRQEMIKYWGIEGVFEHLEHETLDEDDNGYKLYKCKLGNNLTQVFLYMKCPSTGDIHINPVDDKCQTTTEALLFMNHNISFDMFGVQT